MGLSRYEQEVMISLNADDETAILYSSHPMWIREMDRLAEKFPEMFRVRCKTNLGKTYELPKHLVHIEIPDCSQKGVQRAEVSAPLRSALNKCHRHLAPFGPVRAGACDGSYWVLSGAEKPQKHKPESVP